MDADKAVEINARWMVIHALTKIIREQINELRILYGLPIAHAGNPVGLEGVPYVADPKIKVHRFTDEDRNFLRDLHIGEGEEKS